MDPLVSVVIPTYDRHGFLVEAVRSVASQTYGRIELVAVDDHSPEPVEPVLEDVDTGGLDRVECIRHSENRGANAARNTGIRASEGEIVAFLDDDDRWTPTVAERYVETFRDEGEDVGLVTVGMNVVDEDGRQIGAAIPEIADGPLEELLSGTMVGSFSRFAVRSPVIERAGLPDERLPAWQDWEWQFRLARHCRFASVPEPLVIRTRGEHEQITNDFADRRDVSYPIMLERHREFVAERGRRAEGRFVALLSRSLAASALTSGRYRQGIGYLLRALKHDPWCPETYAYLLTAVGGPTTYKAGKTLKRHLDGLGGGGNASSDGWSPDR